MNSNALASEATTNELGTSVFVGRQPIFTNDRQTYAYELLFRSGQNNEAEFHDGDCATAELLLNTFTSLGIDRIVGGHRAFVNVTEGFLLGGHCESLPLDQFVIEVLEHVPPTDAVIAKLSELKNAGYTIALDDFVYSPELLPLVELADIVKVDLHQTPTDQLAEHLDLFRKHKLQLLAEKIETEEEFKACRELGFDYFQGYYFSRPTIVSGKKLSANRAIMLNLISKLQDPAANPKAIAEIIQTEPTLTYQLMRYVNSSACGLRHKIESVEHATVFAGLSAVKTICSLSMLARATEDQPGELVRTILIRAKMCELLAAALGESNTDSYFLAGMMSALDALLDLPMDQALELVAVAEEVEEAITIGGGSIGPVLKCVLTYEQGQWQDVTCSPLDVGEIVEAYWSAVEWVDVALNHTVHD